AEAQARKLALENEKQARQLAEEARRQADLARAREQEAREQELRARREAQRARAQAEMELQRARRLLYFQQMALAQRALEGNNLKRAQELLEREMPPQGGHDLRGFEWHYLHRLAQLAK